MAHVHKRQTCDQAMTEQILFVPVPDADTNWSGFTAVIPSVAVGNVPQLTVDLLISTLLLENDTKLAGRILTPCFRAIAGPNPYDVFSCQPASSCEVYVSSERKLVILQIRTPPFRETRRLLVELLVQWIEEQSFDRTIILSSSFSQCLPEPHIELSGLTIKYLLTSSASGEESLMKEGEIAAVARVDADSLKFAADGVYLLPGTGFGLKLFQQLQERSRKAILLVSYCSEGDNRPEARNLVQLLGARLLGMDGKQWVKPISWKNMFGTESRTDIF